MYLTLPDVRNLRTENPATTAFIELRAREARARGEQPRRNQKWVSYGRISQNLTRAVLVTEDSAFWQHEGIDFEQLRESMEVNLERMEFARGGSTITQQLAKNLYLSPSKNPVRKAREFLIARRLEGELPKQRILELYLNLIEWGDGIYGAEAAARTYFRKSAADLVPLRGRAARRRDRESAGARSGASDGAPSPSPADGDAAHGRRDAAARHCHGPTDSRAAGPLHGPTRGSPGRSPGSQRSRRPRDPPGAGGTRPEATAGQTPLAGRSAAVSCGGSSINRLPVHLDTIPSLFLISTHVSASLAPL